MKPRYLISAAIIALYSIGFADVPDEPIEIGFATQYFIDDYLVDNIWALKLEKEEVVREWHVAEKYAKNPLITASAGYFTVIYDADMKLYKMWYQDFWLQKPKPNPKFTYGIAYAESKDGLNWELPDLGLFEWKGSRHNNIVWIGWDKQRAAGQAILDIPDKFKKGYKYVMIYKGSRGMHLVATPDGIHWDEKSNMLIGYNYHPDTQNTIVWDDKIGKFVWFNRSTHIYSDSGKRKDGGATRRIARIENQVLWQEWKVNAQNIILPDALDVKSGFHFFYGMPTRYYNGIYWGFLWPFKSNTEIHTTLSVSRDGINFHRSPERTKLLGVGMNGEWDDGMVMASVSWVEHGKEWWIYYAGFDGPHSDMKRNSGIGLAKIRKEGFVSLKGPQGGGVVCTRLIRWPGGNLQVNVNASKGALQVRISDEKRKIIPGYDYTECEVFSGNEIRHTVKWKNHDMSELKDKNIRIEFLITDANIYTFKAEK